MVQELQSLEMGRNTSSARDQAGLPRIQCALPESGLFPMDSSPHECKYIEPIVKAYSN
jgi:hypothetical protein